MDRMTEKDKSGNYLQGDIIYGDWGVPEKFRGYAVDRLAEYEDTGLEPDEIKDNMDMFRAYRHVCAGHEPEHIRELLKAEQDGRLMVLPCKLGDSFFAIRKFCDEYGELEEPVEHWGSDCYYCNFPCNGKLKVVEKKFNSIRHVLDAMGSIGVSIFFTGEED